ncbi:MAG: glycosyltransferase family 2 protein [Anaerolineae bacterium]
MSETAMESTRGVSGHKIVAVIPAYNEERFIGSVVLKARQYADAVIVVDDGSTDATGEIAQAAGAIVVRHEHNRGKGAAFNTGFCKAREMTPEVVVTLDGDWQHRCEEIPTLARPVLEDGADMVVGSRFLEVKSRIPGFRALAIRALTMATNIGSGLGLTDSQTGLRAFSPRVMETVTFRSGGFSVESEMQFLAREHDLKVVEVPITCHYDDGPKRNPIPHWLQVLNGVLRLIGQYRPLLFFGVPGMGMLLFGLFWGARVVGIYRDTQILAVGYALLSVLLSTLGSLSLFTGIILHSIRALLLEMLGRFNKTGDAAV